MSFGKLPVRSPLRGIRATETQWKRLVRHEWKEVPPNIQNKCNDSGNMPGLFVFSSLFGILSVNQI